jgi:hypothetical protein
VLPSSTKDGRFGSFETGTEVEWSNATACVPIQRNVSTSWLELSWGIQLSGSKKKSVPDWKTMYCRNQLVGVEVISATMSVNWYIMGFQRYDHVYKAKASTVNQ